MKTNDMTEAQKNLIEAAQEVCHWIESTHDQHWLKEATLYTRLKSALEAVNKEGE